MAWRTRDQRIVHEFKLQRTFSNLNINERVSFFNKTTLNIVSNFVPHDTIIYDDRDPPWINTQIKNVINNKKILYKNIFVAAKMQKCLKKWHHFKIRLLIPQMIQETYYTRISNKLNGSRVSPKPYCQFLKCFWIITKRPLFYFCSIKIGLWLILQKRLIYLTYFLLNSAL